MAKYVNMEDMRGHLRGSASSPAFADEILMCLGRQYDRMASHGGDQNISMKAAGMVFRQLRAQIKRGSNSSLQRSITWLILDNLIECEYWKNQNRRYFLTIHGLTTYFDQCRQLEHDYENESTESVSSEEIESEVSEEIAPTEEAKTPSAKDTALQLEPTFLSDEDREMIEQNLSRLHCFQFADKINREVDNCLVSIQQDHAMIMINGNYKDIYDKLIKIMDS